MKGLPSFPKTLLEIDELSANITETDVPHDFCLQFQWDDENGEMTASLADETVYLGDGWFLRDDRTWSLPGWAESDEWWISQKIQNSEIPMLLGQVIPDMRSRDLPVLCTLVLSQENALRLEIQEVFEDSVKVTVSWKSAAPFTVTGLENYVFDGRTFYPAIPPTVIGGIFGESESTGGCEYLLCKEQIPIFMNEAMTNWKSFVHGDTDRLLRMHKIYQSAELVLVGYPEIQNGIGCSYALPMLLIDGQLHNVAASVSRQIKLGVDYVRVNDGWISVKLLQETGIGPMGRATNGFLLDKPFVLTPEEILYRGSERLHGPWERMMFPEFVWPFPEESPALGQLNFLARWGINGGLKGGLEQHAAALGAFLSIISNQSPAARILVVGKKGSIDQIQEQWAALSAMWITSTGKAAPTLDISEGIIIVTPNVLAKSKVIQTTVFDLLVLLEPDGMTKSSETQIYRHLKRLKSRLKVAVYANENTSRMTPLNRVQMSILGLVNDTETLPYKISDPRKKRKELPQPYRMVKQQQMTINRNDINFAEFEVGGKEKGVAIPPREDPLGGIVRSTGSETVLPTSYLTSEQRFVERAKELEHDAGSAAPLVPFMTYWPNYDSMTASQTKWYFYWRGEIRNERYPDTDLSYIFLYIYELINGIGWQEPLQGVQLLSGIWAAYRSKFPRLDFYLADWIADFILVHELDLPFQDLFVRSERGTTGDLMEMELMRLFRTDPKSLTLDLLSRLSDYDVLRSKFYLDLGRTDLEFYVPKVIALVDSYIHTMHGLRLIDMFHPGEPVARLRYIFRSAIYDSSIYGRTVTLRVVNVSEHAPLRDFITQLIRLTENKLRELRGFKGRLRGAVVEPEIEMIVTRYLDEKFAKAKAEKLPQQKMSIDQQKLAQLTEDSEVVRALLTVETPDEEEKDAGVIFPPFGQKREGCSAHGIEQEPVEELLSRLNSEQGLVLESLMGGGGALEEQKLAQVTGDLFMELIIDEVNEMSLELLGTLMIIQEDGIISLAEEACQALKYRDASPAIPRQTDPSNEIHWCTDGFSPEWIEFADTLSAVQLEVLYSIKMGTSSTELLHIAEMNGSMPSLLIDDINNLSMEMLGDLIIVDDTIAIEYADYFETLTR